MRKMGTIADSVHMLYYFAPYAFRSILIAVGQLLISKCTEWRNCNISNIIGYSLQKDVLTSKET